MVPHAIFRVNYITLKPTHGVKGLKQAQILKIMNREPIDSMVPRKESLKVTILWVCGWGNPKLKHQFQSQNAPNIFQHTLSGDLAQQSSREFCDSPPSNCKLSLIGFY